LGDFVSGIDLAGQSKNNDAKSLITNCTLILTHSEISKMKYKTESIVTAKRTDNF